MLCPKCLVTPGYHSFVNFTELNGAKLFYTAPAKTQDFNEDGTKLANIKIHIAEETEGKPWIWVLDCANMAFHHYTEVSFNIGVLDILANDPQLQEIWIIHPNMWIYGVHGFFNTFSSAPILTKVSYFDGCTLELIDHFNTKGLTMRAIEWLINQ